ncbi:uncharacterized protein LOC123511681 [Portunus trituberculatus]|uniref:uncharacterized protein LOC123511681 n=1 Tax=Portunus trituberculatus TaxID=210409 RepID=UPI001E1CEC97|nr:uncharacterized protein LOC123511681 [Portunus trituberculatus]
MCVDMFRTATVPLPVCLAVVVLMIVMVVGVGPGLAAPTVPTALPRQELMKSIMVNQMAILKGMNESTSTFVPNGEEVNHLHDKIDLVNCSVQTRIQELSEEMKNKLDAMNNTFQTYMAEMNEKVMNETQRVTKKIEAIQNTFPVHPRPDPADLYVLHNDTEISTCDGHKVLYGSQGYLAVSEKTEGYKNNMDCSWEVTLPEGSRPVFNWISFQLANSGFCNTSSDYVTVRDPDHPTFNTFCIDNAPDGSFITVMNNKFIVAFHSNAEDTSNGFKLRYRAVSRT